MYLSEENREKIITLNKYTNNYLLLTIKFFHFFSSLIILLNNIHSILFDKFTIF